MRNLAKRLLPVGCAGWWLLLGLVFGLFSAAEGATGPKALTDTGITRAVHRELQSDPGVEAHRVDVATDQGQVTLSGTVGSILAKERASRVARTVKGVTRVTNTITVSPPPRSDTQIRESVLTALMMDPATEHFTIQVSVEQGRVTLQGTVDSLHEKELAGTVAKSVTGVTKLQNRLTVKLKAVRPAVEIAPEIEQALKWNPLVNHEQVDVFVSDGVVELTGTVDSAAAKQQAVREARTSGVLAVDAEHLAVLPSAAAEKPKRPFADPEIRQAVVRKLRNQPRVDSFDITVAVTDGMLTLRGHVDHLKAKRTAEWTARNTSGVWRVKNKLLVRPDDLPSDSSITLKVRSALKRDPILEHEDIAVSVDNGRVTLSGSVDSVFERGQAADAASRVNGVLALDNNLDVYGSPSYRLNPYRNRDMVIEGYDEYAANLPSLTSEKDDWEILRDIRNELWWSPFVDQNEVTVQVHNRVAVLSGTVDSLQERSAAQENAYQGGAVSVKNRLRVEQGPKALQP